MDLCGHFRVFKRDKISILLTKKLSLFQPHREFKKNQSSKQYLNYVKVEAFDTTLS